MWWGGRGETAFTQRDETLACANSSAVGERATGLFAHPVIQYLFSSLLILNSDAVETFSADKIVPGYQHLNKEDPFFRFFFHPRLEISSSCMRVFLGWRVRGGVGCLRFDSPGLSRDLAVLIPSVSDHQAHRQNRGCNRHQTPN